MQEKNLTDLQLYYLPMYEGRSRHPAALVQLLCAHFLMPSVEVNGCIGGAAQDQETGSTATEPLPFCRTELRDLVVILLVDYVC